MISDYNTSFGISFILPFGSRNIDDIVVGIILSGAFSDICMYLLFISFFKTIIEARIFLLTNIHVPFLLMLFFVLYVRYTFMKRESESKRKVSEIMTISGDSFLTISIKKHFFVLLDKDLAFHTITLISARLILSFFGFSSFFSIFF